MNKRIRTKAELKIMYNEVVFLFLFFKNNTFASVRLSSTENGDKLFKFKQILCKTFHITFQYIWIDKSIKKMIRSKAELIESFSFTNVDCGAEDNYVIIWY